MTAVTNETIDYDRRFRQYASVGNTAAMLNIFRSGKLKNLDVGGPDAGKTAAHWAAEKGHAAVLRLLASLGDTFIAKNNAGFTAAEISTTPECSQVFVLVSAAQETLKVCDRIFPQKLDVQKCDKDQWKKLAAARFSITEKSSVELEKIAIVLLSNLLNECMAAKRNHSVDFDTFNKWVYDFNMHMSEFFPIYRILELALKNDLLEGACGENSAAGYAYLSTHHAKLSIDRVTILTRPDNHAFLVLNRNQDLAINDFTGWKMALIVDPFARTFFFYENISHIEKSLIPKEILTSTVTMVNGNKKLTPPSGLPWIPQETLKMMQEVWEARAKDTKKILETILEKRG